MKAGAIIFGGTGFVGQHLAHQLSDRYAVTALGRDCDVRDRAAVRGAIERVRPALAVNLAAIATVQETVDDSRCAYETGIFGTLNILEGLSTLGFNGRFLQVSSSEVYGYPSPEELPLDESAPLRPMSPYAVAKIAGEMLCQTYPRRADFAVYLARPFTHIGPGQSHRFAVARFARQIAEIEAGQRGPMLAVGSLARSRDLTDVRDVVRGYDLILHEGKPGTVYNLCSGREILIGVVLDELIRLSGRHIRFVEDASLVRTAEQLRLCGSFERLYKDTRWRPAYSLSQTLADTLAAARAAVLTSSSLCSDAVDVNGRSITP